MAWKIIASFVAIFLATGGVFRYLNYVDLKSEKNLRQRSEKNLLAMEDRHKEVEAEKAGTDLEITETTTERDRLDTETKATDEKTSEVKGQIATVTAARDALTKRLDELNAVQVRIGPLNDVIADIKRLAGVNQATNEQIATTKGQIADAVAKTAENQAVIDTLAALKVRQDLRKMDEKFSAKVQRVYDQWGFLVIDAGAQNEVYTSAELEVIRSGDVIGRVKITNVEPSVAVCDILKDTFEDGLSVRPGDTVQTVKAVAVAPPAEGVTPPVVEPTLPVNPGPAAPSIFDVPGGGAAPMGGAADPDPFGAPAGGAAPAPAGGAAPAPAGGAAPAPAGGAAPVANPFD